MAANIQWYQALASTSKGAKGRRGKRGSNRLSDDQVRKIKIDLQTLKVSEVARNHGISYAVVDNIKQEVNYKDVTI